MKSIFDKNDSTEVIRVLIAKVGLDGHDRGVKIVARCLRDAGMEVIYTGLHRTPEEVVTSAVQEDVDVLGVSLLSGAHMTIFPKIIELLKVNEAEDILLLGGGVMSDDDAESLKKMGVSDVLLQDTPPDLIVETVRRLVAERGRLTIAHTCRVQKATIGCRCERLWIRVSETEKSLFDCRRSWLTLTRILLFIETGGMTLEFIRNTFILWKILNACL